ncbi:hypothetical protein K458DRAFT_412975 [Lentithecium fluviatile CBS 122367]|uniref:C2H2-type domain-containing protein n=1 Tax=Lentithecium fluviatile CBS 122367 TaxID=1168545 RepID=A0A6G1JI58_9PLEO|nr:hypothetical protein K458DRAFT_412975 [Lentithecium fluviatile CBS 122367]
MADKKAGAYGAKPGGGDTDFRKTYDREEYARRAKAREEQEKIEGQARYEAKLQGKTYYRRASTPEDVKLTTARDSRLDVASRVGTVQLVQAGAQGRRRGFGFVCEACDYSCSNNHEFLEHQSSTRHLRNVGATFDVERADVSMVRERLRYLARKRKEASRPEILDLDKRLEERKVEEEKEREEKRRKRNEKRRSKKQQEEW